MAPATGCRTPWPLVGFDNWDVIAAACRPPLTTVDMNLRQLGRAAGERLLSAVDGHPGSGLQLLPCRLVVRESSQSRGSGAV
jgi:LacI family transcriptional regulator